MAVAVLFVIPLHPDKASVYLALGMLPLFVWVPRQWVHLDARKPLHAILSGFLAAGFSVAAGISSTLMDIFFVHTRLSRHEIVATKAMGQIIGHGVKLIYWGWAVLRASGLAAMPPWWLFALALPLSFAGTWCGKAVLARMSNKGFIRIVRVLITLIGLYYIVLGVRLLAL